MSSLIYFIFQITLFILPLKTIKTLGKVQLLKQRTTSSDQTMGCSICTGRLKRGRKEYPTSTSTWLSTFRTRTLCAIWLLTDLCEWSIINQYSYLTNLSKPWDIESKISLSLMMTSSNIGPNKVLFFNSWHKNKL